MYTITSHRLHQSLAQRMETLHHPQLVSAHAKRCTKVKRILCLIQRHSPVHVLATQNKHHVKRRY